MRCPGSEVDTMSKASRVDKVSAEANTVAAGAAGIADTASTAGAESADTELVGTEPVKRKHHAAPAKIYGYARVSTRDQNLDRQLLALANFPVEDCFIYADKATGADFHRPSYQRLLRRLCPGDVVVIKSIDRLGRNYEEILEQWRHITKTKAAHVVVLDMPLLDTRSTQGGLTDVFLADVVLQLLSYVAQVERENTHQRQAEGIAAARARGVRFGRPAIERPQIYAQVKAAYCSGRVSRKEAACQLGVGSSTFSRWLKQDIDAQGMDAQGA